MRSSPCSSDHSILRLPAARIAPTSIRLLFAHATSPLAVFHTPHTHAFSAPHHARSVHAGKTTLILDDAPDFFVRQLPAESDHAGTGRSVLDHPEDFTFRAMAPESIVLEITGRWVELCGQRAISTPIFPMTVEAGPLTIIERFAPLDDLRGTRQRACDCARFGQLFIRHPWLHHVPFGCPRRGGQRNPCTYQREYTRLHHRAPFDRLVRRAESAMQIVSSAARAGGRSFPRADTPYGVLLVSISTPRPIRARSRSCRVIE